MGMELVLLMMKLFILMVALVVHGSEGHDASPSTRSFLAVPPIEVRAPTPANPVKSLRTSTQSPPPILNGFTVHSSPQSAPKPVKNQGPEFSPSLSPPMVLAPSKSAFPPQIIHALSPATLPIVRSHGVPPRAESPIMVPHFPDPAVIPPLSAPPPSNSKKSTRFQVAQTPKAASDSLSPQHLPPNKGYSSDAPAPFKSPSIPPRKWAHSPASPPLTAMHNHLYTRKVASPAPSSSYQARFQSPTKGRPRHHYPPSNKQGPDISPAPPYFSKVHQASAAPSPLSTASSSQTKSTLHPPTVSPSRSVPRKPKASLPPPILSLPPPPPNTDCTALTCMDPLVNTPPGSLCGCVWPIQVGLRLSVALYTFFPLVTELAEEIGRGILMELSQVRIMGANAAGEQLEKTIVLINLVPRGNKFDKATAMATYEKFWRKQVLIKPSFFGEYEVLYVRYPGLPSSPPSAASTITSLEEGLHSTRVNNGSTRHPLGADVSRKQKQSGFGGNKIVIIVLVSSMAMALCIGVAWLLLLQHGDHRHHTRLTKPTSKSVVPPLSKQSGIAGSALLESRPGSAFPSLSSTMPTYTGSAKSFSADEIKRATDNFDSSKILGEGGFGLVYRGIFDDGKKVAVKVLKRNDQQGDREFLAEVEMLSRLHHRNLVKLIGICTEGHLRCLIYDLVPNGSVEYHLHGLDKESVPLDWCTRMKIALGAARGLAYLHEDSSPRVIHRDFKCGNILLEHDFTPKVSDFGLARTAMDEGNSHISTRVMGTFGYVAPEYAMTGHLLVKSDVYSYGVVLLELLTGRKPVDMSQPPGEENLVTWARPLLNSKEGLERILDPSIRSDIPFDSVAKVAAIASMCVQPEVTNRPFMGEVVQALKLVCSEFDATKAVSVNIDEEDSSLPYINRRSTTGLGSCQLLESSRARYEMDYRSSCEITRPLSVSDVFSTSPRLCRQDSGSFRRHSSSGPVRTGRNRQFWEKVRGLSRGSFSEHRFAFRLWPESR